MTYEFRFVLNGEITFKAERECADDLDALDEALRLADGHDVEIWDGERFIARVEPGAAPLNEKDQTSNRSES